MRFALQVISYCALVSVSVASSFPHGLDALTPKDFNVSRGFNYHYYSTPSRDADKPYLVFIHGWPSSAYDWRYQIDYFSNRGFGVIVPDMLGYGGTAKPLETEAYKFSLLAKDIVDILDHEQVEDVIAVGHDWGSDVASRLANAYEDRFLGFAFYAAGYQVPSTATYSEISAASKAIMGYDQWGYWDFLSSQDTATQIIQANPDSLWSIVFASDSRLFIPHFAPHGALQAWLESGSKTETFLSEQEYNISKAKFLATGITASLNVYRTMTSDIFIDDNKGVPLSAYNITKPVFFGGASRDYLAVPAIQRSSLFGYAANYTFQDYETGHWVMIQKPEEVNKDLLNWIENTVTVSA